MTLDTLLADPAAKQWLWVAVLLVAFVGASIIKAKK